MGVNVGVPVVLLSPGVGVGVGLGLGLGVGAPAANGVAEVIVPFCAESGPQPAKASKAATAVKFRLNARMAKKSLWSDMQEFCRSVGNIGLQNMVNGQTHTILRRLERGAQIFRSIGLTSGAFIVLWIVAHRAERQDEMAGSLDPGDFATDNLLKEIASCQRSF